MRSYSGVSCCSTRKRRDLEQEIQQLEKEKLVLAEVAQPKPKDTRKAVDLEEGNYFCKTYAKMDYRGKKDIVLFLQEMDEYNQPTTDETIPTTGYFLEKEVEGSSLGNKPLCVHLGEKRNTPQRHKDRLYQIVVVE